MTLGRSILLVEPTPWSGECAERLTERGYVVEAELSWAAALRRLRKANYDMILLNEREWKANFASVAGVIRDGHRIAALATDYSRGGHRMFSEAGASGYLNQKLSLDPFLIELEKVLTMAGLAPLRGRILIVDNDAQVREALRNRLHIENYEVKVASNAADALKAVKEFQPHVVVVDIRLRDDKDRLDDSGFDLIDRIDSDYGHAVKLIGLTGSPTRSSAPRAAAGRLVGFVLKDVNPKDETLKVDELLRHIQAAHQSLEINSVLEIEYEEPLTLKGLVRMMGSYRDLPAEQQARAASEVEELVRKLFPRELKVAVYHLSPRREGSGIALVRPTVDGSLGNFMVMKFGPRERIEIEVEKYRSFVDSFIEAPATKLRDVGLHPVETMNLGAIKFSLAGLGEEKPQTFREFFLDGTVSEKEVAEVLDHLFGVTCGSWYKHRQDWSHATSEDLLKGYSVHALREDKRAAVKVALEELTRGESFRGVSLRREKDSLRVHLGVNDLSFPDVQKAFDTPQMLGTFRSPRFRCRNHGNLHSLNVLLDSTRRAWLIDFSETGWGPSLRDFVQMEASIKFELLGIDDFPTLYEIEKCLLTPGSMRERFATEKLARAKELDKTLAAIAAIRNAAERLASPLDLREYYYGLFCHALRMIAFEGATSTERGRMPVRQRHSILSAAMVCYRLKNWQPWPGWPDERSVVSFG